MKISSWNFTQDSSLTMHFNVIQTERITLIVLRGSLNQLLRAKFVSLFVNLIWGPNKICLCYRQKNI